MAHLGIKSSSDDPLNMQDTIIIPKTSTNLNEIVNAHKRAVVALDPETRVEEMQYEPPVMPSFFPLEYFDDRTYETRTAK